MNSDHDESVRAFLANLPGDRDNTPPGTIAIFKHTVEELGGDNAAVYDWVQKHGGTVKAAQAPQIGAELKREMRAYYEIPLGALRDPSSGGGAG